jgi:hypothetical protein
VWLHVHETWLGGHVAPLASDSRPTRSSKASLRSANTA